MRMVWVGRTEIGGPSVLYEVGDRVEVQDDPMITVDRTMVVVIADQGEFSFHQGQWGGGKHVWR